VKRIRSCDRASDTANADSRQPSQVARVAGGCLWTFDRAALVYGVGDGLAQDGPLLGHHLGAIAEAHE